MLPILVAPVFDEFVALTAYIFRLPISLISIVEEEEVLYPVHHGLGHDRQPRVEALCATAMGKARAVVYHDLALETSATLPPDARRTAHARSATSRDRSWALSNAAPIVLLK